MKNIIINILYILITLGLISLYIWHYIHTTEREMELLALKVANNKNLKIIDLQKK